MDTGPSGCRSRCLTCTHLSGHTTGPSGRWSRCVTCTHLSGHRTQWLLVKVCHLYTPEWTHYRIQWSLVKVCYLYTPEYSDTTGPSGRWSRCLTCIHLSGHRTQWSLVKVSHLHTPEWTQDPVVTGQVVSPVHT